VLVADADEPFRRVIADLINAQPDMCVVAEAADGEHAEWLTRSLRPNQLDLVVLDINLSRGNGISLAQQISAIDPALPVVILTASTSDNDLFDAVRAGAVGYLVKSIKPEAVVRALRDYCRKGAMPMSRVTAASVFDFFRKRRAPSNPTAASEVVASLSAREREVLVLMSAGATDRAIAEQLMIRERTVKQHVRRILQKVRARDRADALTRLRRPSS
jgi:DNA-binding NarL/FixJ family response regulator